jgi:hypothetical protein
MAESGIGVEIRVGTGVLTSGVWPLSLAVVSIYFRPDPGITVDG